MPIIQKLTQRTSPGVYVTEDTYGSTPALLANHGNVYVMGTCSSANFPYNTPIYISNYNDFLTQCISSPSSAAINLFFNQRSGSGLFFIRVAPRQQSTISTTTFTPGTFLTLTVGAATVNYFCVAGDTATSAINGLGLNISNSLTGVASFYRDAFGNAIVRTPVGVTLLGANIAIGTSAIAAYPKAYDVADSISYTFVPENGQGYLCAPEFYQAYTLQSERTLLQLQMESLCSDPRFYWVSVVDFGQSTAQSTFIVNAAQSERATYTSPRGNSWAIFPYLLDTAGTVVPSSLGMIGVALRRSRSDGFAQPPAGTNYPIYGVTGTTANITSAIQDQLNPLGINCIRILPARGVVVYGARTLATNPYYIFAATRVILNVLAGTLRNSFDSIVFSLIDGQGVLFSRVRQTAANVCERLRLGGALYGATPTDAYLVVCDGSNNTGDALDAGIVSLDVIVKPSPTLEALNITLSRASLSSVLVEILASGDTTIRK